MNKTYKTYSKPLLASYSESLLYEAGVDEAGRGCLAGPVVAAAVILPAYTELEFLDDSKKLSAGLRQSLCNQIKNQALAWAIGSACPAEIDKINILQATFLAMHRAIDQLSVRADLLLIDGNRFANYNTINHVCLIAGDARFKSIAAASVLAKVYRDALMDKLNNEYPVYNWRQNKGYPTLFHRQAIAEHELCEHHRKSFKIR